jgi:methyl-accepting chemotaxis protein
MILTISIMVLLLIVGVSWFAYNQANDILYETLLHEASSNAKNNAQIVTKWLEGIENEIIDMTHTDTIKSMDWTKQQRLLKEVANSYEHMNALYVADVSGDFQITSGSNGNVADREYFQRAMETGEAVISKPIVSKATGDQIVVIGSPVMVEGQAKGFLGATIDLNYLQKIAKDMQINGYGYGWIITSEKNTVAHPAEKYIGNKNVLDDGNQELRDIATRMASGEVGTANYRFKGIEKILGFAPIELTDWSIAITVKSEDILAPLKVIRNGTLLIGLIAIILGIIITYFVAAKISEPILESSAFADEIASGNLKVEPLENQYNDEIGSLISALNKMRDSLRDMTIDLLDTTENLSANSQELSASSEEGNAVIETSNENIEEMTASIQQISASNQEVTGFAEEANSQSQLGGQKIEETVESMEEINQAVEETVVAIQELDTNSEEIGKIVEMITAIAEQTNLLALNAAIEAARAGEHGQGFAVVAEEIRELAEQTAQATDEISGLIEDTQEKSEQGLSAVNLVEDRAQKGKEIVEETGEVFDQIKSSIEETSAHIQETAASAQNLAESSDEVMNASQDIRNMSDEITNSSQELAKMAQDLQKLVERFEV